eukprot:scaffold43750_cov45-Phaeocystis_antarctica.AAC.1
MARAHVGDGARTLVGRPGGAAWGCRAGYAWGAAPPAREARCHLPRREVDAEGRLVRVGVRVRVRVRVEVRVRGRGRGRVDAEGRLEQGQPEDLMLAADL